MLPSLLSFESTGFCFRPIFLFCPARVSDFFSSKRRPVKSLGEVAACCVILWRISDNRFLFTGHLEGIGVRNFIQPLILKVECSSTTSAWRSPRVLSGFLASTPHTSQGDCTLWPKFRPNFSSRRNSVSSSTRCHTSLSHRCRYLVRICSLVNLFPGLPGVARSRPGILRTIEQ